MAVPSTRSAITTRARIPIEINVDEQKAAKWLQQGAQPTDTVARLFRRVGVLPEVK